MTSATRRQEYRDCEGNLLPAPKTRTDKALRREIRAASSASLRKRHRTGRLGYATRAYQYALWAVGLESFTINEMPYDLERKCRWDFAPDGSIRVRAVEILGDRSFLIPHWDFVPECVDITGARGVFA
ncbi:MULTISPECIES: hypothetical protein [unclassified Aurantimonas]|uniref:hypothetical protein n=1 Tax=unclassified Aurantimonas TaxID=2638230 RepID=UPI002E17B8B0|nr:MULTISPECIES: hypothetical protein [unclassified Aurantimonas]MEC5291572.1 hypothetical protein [Aurantimonas sp. C2-3-R2]MEC5412656.1 hypothetical protein [Aurantimonas sp. C2-4-R8]